MYATRMIKVGGRARPSAVVVATTCFDANARLVQLALAALAVAILLLASLAPASAQGQNVRVNGRILWIMGQKMVVAPLPAGVPVNVDLTQLDTSQYATLAPGTLVDVTGIPGVGVGDEVILLGVADGLSVDALEHAKLANSTPYEILCNISKRVPRRYVS